jgi:hypothetical protein
LNPFVASLKCSFLLDYIRDGHIKEVNLQLYNLNYFMASKCDLKFLFVEYFSCKDLACRVQKKNTLDEFTCMPSAQKIHSANKQACRVFFFAVCKRTLCGVYFCGTQQIKLLPIPSFFLTLGNWLSTRETACFL